MKLRPDPDYTEMSWWWLIGWSIGAGLMCMLAVSACARAIPAPSTPVAERVTCAIDELPGIPAVLSFEATEEVASHRVYTTYAQLAELRLWLAALSTWTGNTNECLRRLSQR